MIPPPDQLWRFFDLGGPVTWAILGASLLMWTLILERYWYYLGSLPGERRKLVARWSEMRDTDRRLRSRLRQLLLDAQALHLRRYLGTIRTLSATLPLLGLLGTVSGMIDSFGVLADTGSGNVRGLAAGISQALFTTMAGLMTALSGYFFSVNLEARATTALNHLQHQLK